MTHIEWPRPSTFVLTNAASLGRMPIVRYKHYAMAWPDRPALSSVWLIRAPVGGVSRVTCWPVNGRDARDHDERLGRIGGMALADAMVLIRLGWLVRFEVLDGGHGTRKTGHVCGSVDLTGLRAPS